MRDNPRRLVLRTALAGMATVATVLLVAAGPPAIRPEQTEFFETRVRPVLVESCGKCHGAAKQSSGLRLDSREALIEGGENGPAVVPGNPDASLLLQVVRQTHPDLKMPPKGKLSEPAIEALAAWVTMGAPWPAAAQSAEGMGTTDPAASHWAFRPLASVKPPTVKDPGWVQTPVDAFILDRLEHEGLSPSPEADRRTLIRRLTFDLTGLPPTPEEVDAFRNDESPGAVERLVDRLLESPHYGERWGRHWLDVARYADTKGYVFNQERRYPYSYTYRDYVIHAFNADKPYDEFLVEQIAADRLGPERDPRSLAALGFLTVGRRFLNVKDDIIDDQIDVVTRGLLGLTVACARCHDHKFDPIPTDDYYSLYGVFNSSVEPDDPPEVPGTVPEALSQEFRARLAEKQKQVDDVLAQRLEEVKNDYRDRFAEYLRAAVALKFDPKNSRLDEVARADKLPQARLRGFTARWKSRLDATANRNDPVLAPWHAFAALSEAEFSMKAADVSKAFDAQVNPAVAAELADRPPETFAEVVKRYGVLLTKVASEKDSDRPGWPALRQWLLEDDGPLAIKPDALPRLLDRSERQKIEGLKNQVAQLRVTHPGSPPRAMVLNDLPRPIEPHVFLRGNSSRQGKPVPRRFLKVLSSPERPPFTDGSGRLDLARAIANRNNPLTARVMVNRVWLNHFGTGLVSTPSDFGLRSDPPSHPELLDWLANDFMRNGWSIKTLHRRIVLSSTYRQRSEDRPLAKARDPENRLLWKANRRRLDFEAMRDALLASSGALDATMGGRSAPISDPPFSSRRTVYGFIDRQNLDGVYRTFDFPSPDATNPRRFATTVPQQALFLMNSPFVIDQARRLAARPEVVSGDPERRVKGVYARLFGRTPSDHELALATDFLRRSETTGPSLPAPAWTYGYGRVDESAGRVADFRPLPHWTGSAWQFGPTLPDSEGRYLFWKAGGGHAGPDAAHAAILRWTAPAEAVVSISGTFGHEGMQGDGVRGRLLSSRSGLLGEWTVLGQTSATTVPRVAVQPGETLDFVVESQTNDAFDSFTWAPVLRASPSASSALVPASWDANADFHGPSNSGLSPWEQYAQVLLLTNEFAFVD